MAAFAARGLAKRYGAVEALGGVDLEVGEGELFGLLGPNGAGKSTLVKIAVGLVRQSGGDAEVAGARAGSRAARASLGYLAELFRFPGWYTADEVLELHQQLAGSRGGAAERRGLLELVALADASARRVDGMSKGMQQRLGIAQALVGEPRLLLLDEPTSALDPVGRRTVRLLLEDLRDRGVSVLLNSHLLSEIELVCDRVAILLAGEVVAAGTPAELSRPGGGSTACACSHRRSRTPTSRRSEGRRIEDRRRHRRVRLSRGGAAQGVRRGPRADRGVPLPLLAREPLRVPRALAHHPSDGRARGPADVCGGVLDRACDVRDP